MKEYQAFLFDLDGTLVDTEMKKILAKQSAVKSLGGNVSTLEIQQFIGLSEETVCTELLRLAGIHDEWQKLSSLAQEIYIETLASVTVRPGVKDFLQTARQRNKKLALVTSSTKRMLDRNTALQAIIHLFEIVIDAESVGKHKPDPMPYQRALELLDIDPKQAIAFEDSGAGLMSASGAGLDCVFIEHSLNGDVDATVAVQTITDFENQTLAKLL